ncbi:hypothetical protein PG997_001556 [Apiospora hydei]|uniref:Uncharacterized protein n=1 Tax=Apiospora hydei TaxID=1337664 RepID=A0ABR1XDW9_9PEZI
MSTIPLISQLKSAWQFVTGDAEGAKETWHQFTDAWTQHPGQTILDMAESVPLIGHIIGIFPTIGVESARHGRFQPHGYIATGSEAAAGDWRGGIFDSVALGVGDGWVGSEGGSGRTTKVYRVEGESYVRSGNTVTWESNRRLFPDGDGVIADPHKFPTVKYYTRGNKGDGKAVVLGLSSHRSSGNMLFMNYGERARADAFYAQRLLQYREAVDQMEERGI